MCFPTWETLCLQTTPIASWICLRTFVVVTVALYFLKVKILGVYFIYIFFTLNYLYFKIIDCLPSHKNNVFRQWCLIFNYMLVCSCERRVSLQLNIHVSTFTVRQPFVATQHQTSHRLPDRLFQPCCCLNALHFVLCRFEEGALHGTKKKLVLVSHCSSAGWKYARLRRWLNVFI